MAEGHGQFRLSELLQGGMISPTKVQPALNVLASKLIGLACLCVDLLSSPSQLPCVSFFCVRWLAQGVLLVNIAGGVARTMHQLRAVYPTESIGGLGLDVTWHEPVDPEDPIFRTQMLL